MNVACWLTRVGLIWGLAVLGTACHTASKGGRHTATVVIPGKSLTAIREMTQKVFEEDGYTGTAGVRTMVFTRPGSTLDNLAYGSWDLSSVSTRVEVTFVEEPSGDYRVECDAFIVRNAGDHVFEDSYKKSSKGKYQKLLNQIRDRLAKS